MLNDKIWRDIFQFGTDIIRANGEEKQTLKTAEELGELQQSCFKALTGRLNHDNMAEEIADVLVVIMQLKLIYDIPSCEVAEWAEYKIARERERMGL